jgi:hypothetical protein
MAAKMMIWLLLLWMISGVWRLLAVLLLVWVRLL